MLSREPKVCARRVRRVVQSAAPETKPDAMREVELAVIGAKDPRGAAEAVMKLLASTDRALRRRLVRVMSYDRDSARQYKRRRAVLEGLSSLSL